MLLIPVVLVIGGILALVLSREDISPVSAIASLGIAMVVPWLAAYGIAILP